MEDVSRVLGLLLLACLAGAVSDVRAASRRTLIVKLPRVTVPGGSNIELCYVVRIPTTTAFEMGAWQIKHVGAKGGTQTNHGLVYLYTGERLSEFPLNQIVQSRGCLDLGPADRDRRVLVVSG